MLVAGVDEAGRGPLAGPVSAAAVILPANHGLIGLDDSKKLKPSVRERLFEEIQTVCVAHAIVHVDAPMIDEINILQATLRAMGQALQALPVAPDLALIDGNRSPPSSIPSVTLVQGDALCPAIAAASVLAKVSRDRIMCDLALRFPIYGFDQHKGYPTQAHRQALAEHGPCEVHRHSFAPVRRCTVP